MILVTQEYCSEQLFLTLLLIFDFFFLYFSKVSGPINATENYIKAHSKLFKYIVLGVLGAGNNL